MTKSYQSVELLGTVGRDAEIKYTPNGIPLANFSVATSKSYKKNDQWQESTEWHNIIAWRDVAEFAGEHCKKGVRILIKGELKTDTYEKEGQKHYSTKIVAESIYPVPHAKRAEKAEQPAETQNAAPVSDDLPF